MPSPSLYPGIGANIYPASSGTGVAPGGGVSFRFWAPFATTVELVGTDGKWDPPGIPLAREDGGMWSVDVPGIGAGTEYRVYVNGQKRMDPRARDVTHSGSEGKCVVSNPLSYQWKNENFQMPPHNELVIYEMHLGTFCDDENAAKEGRALKQAAQELDYLQALGINAIHLLPAGEFPTEASWGYNPALPFALESAYGVPDDLKHFVDTAHGLGIAVIMDVVYNHLGPGDEAAWQFDPGWIPKWEGRDMGGAYFYPDWRAATPWGAANRPDYGRPEVREYFRDNAMMWIHEYRMDGLRFDAVSFIRTVKGKEVEAESPDNLGGWGWNLLCWINNEVKRDHPWKLTIAEDLQNSSAITRPTSDGGAGFTSQWDPNFTYPVREALIAISDEGRDMAAIRRAIEYKYNDAALQRVIYTESHDEAADQNGKARLVRAIGGSDAEAIGKFARKRSTLGTAILMTTPGIPMIFQGQEINEIVPFGDKRYLNWDNYDTFRGIHDMYRDLIGLRRNRAGTTRGLCGEHVHVLHAGAGEEDKVIVCHRWDKGGPGDDVMIVLNMANRTYPGYRIGLPRAGDWIVRLNSDWNGYSADFDNVPSFTVTAEEEPLHGMPFSGSVGIGAYTAVILSQ